MNHPHLRRSFVVSALALVAALAGTSASAHEPCVLSHANNLSECRLPLLRGGFESLDAWTILKGAPTAHPVDGGSVLRMAATPAGITQRIALPLGSTVDTQALPQISLALKVRSKINPLPLDGSVDPRPEPGPARLKVALSLSDDSGQNVVALGETEVEATADQWTQVTHSESARAYAAASWLNVTLTRDDSQLLTELEVDDVAVTLRPAN